MANALFLRPEYRWITAQCEVLKNLEADLGDKLAVKNDQFTLSKGGFTQPFTRFYFQCTKGGYSRDAVVAHFEQVWIEVDLFVRQLRNDPGFLALPETKTLAKQLFLLRKSVAEVERSYRDTTAIRDNTCPKLKILFDRFYGISREFNHALRLENDFFETIPIQMPLHQTVADTVALGRRSMMVATAAKIRAKVAFVWFLFSIPWVALLALCKWTLWNPVELVVRGKITTENPVSWFGKNIDRITNQRIKKTFQTSRYMGQLLHVPVITEEHMEGYRELASSIQRSGGFFSLSQINLHTLSTQQGARHRIDRPLLLRLLSLLTALSSCKSILLSEEHRHDPLVTDALHRAGFREDSIEGRFVRI
ncbi:MAG TPA: hypothetical protein VLE95_03105 [Chlamydiales bacterium]|nr:hypothetical protein [Chlamydiales bacterium]